MAFIEGFIEGTDPARADAALAEMLAVDRANWGFLPNFARIFGHRPRVYAAWRELNGAVKAGMDVRRYELVTLAAAAALRSSYCSLAHGRVLASEGLLPADGVLAVASADESQAQNGDTGLDEIDRAVVRLARRVAGDATSITAADIDEVRQLGLDDTEILDVILAAAARCFFSTVLDATGTLPDVVFAGLPDPLRDALTVGRPIEDRELPATAR